MKDRIELAKYFTELGFKVGAEIGVLQGSYSRALCRYNPELKLYCIDAWDLLKGNRRFIRHQKWFLMRATNKLKDYNTILIKKFSVDAAKQFADNSLDFVYIDASHTYNDVMDDILTWVPKVRKGGIAAGHDYQYDDVRLAVDEYAKKQNIQISVTECDSLNEKTGIPEKSWYFIKA